jgi:hypothetical protein
MDRLINSYSTVTQLWGPITLRNPAYGGDMFSKTSVLSTATQYNVPENIYNRLIDVCEVVSHTRRLPFTPRNIPVKRLIRLQGRRLDGLRQLKNPMASLGIEFANLWRTRNQIFPSLRGIKFVGQCCKISLRQIKIILLSS